MNNNLPDELNLQIMNELNPLDLIQLSRVNVNFHRLFLDTEFWRKYEFKFEHLGQNKTFEYAREHFEEIHPLTLFYYVKYEKAFSVKDEMGIYIKGSDG